MLSDTCICCSPAPSVGLTPADEAWESSEPVIAAIGVFHVGEVS